MLKYITSGWTLLKGIRVGLGLLILLSGIEGHSWGNITVGVFFTLFALLAPGTCCAGSCSSGYQKENDSKKTDQIEYEELGAEK